MSIAILCPTRGRPEQFYKMINSAYEMAYDKNNVKILAAQSEEDSHEYRKQKEHPQYLGSMILPDNMPTAHKWNLLSERTDARLLMLGSDDMHFETPGWDKALLDHYSTLENKIHVYHLQDSRSENGTPHPIVTREYIEAMGYFMPPIFLHWFVDTWTVAIAKANNCFTHMKDYLLVHSKTSDEGVCDETHLGIRRAGWHGRDKYVNDVMCHILDIEILRLKVHTT